MAETFATDQERDAKALEYRKMGMSLAMIAEELGYPSAKAVNDAIGWALERGCQSPGATVLRLELERLDSMFLGSYANACNGDTNSVASCLRIMERRARLLGLDGIDAAEKPVQAMTPKDFKAFSVVPGKAKA